MKVFWLFIYYFIAYNLPGTDFPFIGNISKKIRVFCCRRFNKNISKSANIQKKVFIGSGKCITGLGELSGLGIGTKISNCNVTIGKYFMCGPELLIMGGGHSFEDINIPMIFQNKLTNSSLIIKDDVWIGARVTILKGCSHIGKGVVIGACSVVTHDIPDYAVVAGNPAKIIKFRNK